MVDEEMALNIDYGHVDHDTSYSNRCPELLSFHITVGFRQNVQRIMRTNPITYRQYISRYVVIDGSSISNLVSRSTFRSRCNSIV